MGSRSSVGRIAAMATGALAALAVAAPAASADFHLMKVREVAPAPSGPNSAFIELQMFAPGQNQVAGHLVRSYQADGSLLGTVTIPSNVPNGEDQRTILIGSPGTPGSPDFVTNLDTYLPTIASGGAVCFENIDCVSWGGFFNPGALPSPPGNPAPAIPSGSSLERSIAPNCPTLLEDADDTNNSLADFFIAAPSPRNNATPPTETPCAGGANPGGGPDTKIDKGPKKKTKKKRATFQFSSPTPGVTFECSIDGKAPKQGGSAFGPCASPFKVKVKKGKHTFRVRAVLNGVPDGSPAEYTWKVKKKKKK